MAKIDRQGNFFWFYCPGCKENHRVTHHWDITGTDDKPTISPSVLVDYGEGKTCHFFIQEGMFRYLDDCYHDLKGKTVPMEEYDATGGQTSS